MPGSLFSLFRIDIPLHPLIDVVLLYLEVSLEIRIDFPFHSHIDASTIIYMGVVYFPSLEIRTDIPLHPLIDVV